MITVPVPKSPHARQNKWRRARTEAVSLPPPALPPFLFLAFILFYFICNSLPQTSLSGQKYNVIEGMLFYEYVQFEVSMISC